MNVGSLGDIVFTVSSETIKTLNGYSRTVQANISTHTRHGGTDLVEHSGDKPEETSFNIRLSSALGVSPEETERQIEQYVTKGTPVYLMLGTAKIGRYKWLVKKCKSTAKHYAGTGEVIDMELSLSLVEYLKE